MRICELILAPAFGGAETLALDLASSLRAAGHDVEVVALDGPGETGAAAPGEEVVVAPRAALARGDRLRRLGAARRLARGGDYDVIHAHSYLPNLYARAGVAASRKRIPVVTTLLSASDDFEAPSTRCVESLLGPWTSAVVAMGERAHSEYRRYFPRVRDRVSLIPVGVDRHPFPERRPACPTRFAVVGRLSPQKDLETALRGFAAFAGAAGEPAPTLTVVGPDSDPAYAERMKRLAAELAPEAAIVFLGAREKPLDEVPMDVLVHAATREAHTPIVILEAAARGIPVVCSDAGAMGEAIGWSCTVFPTGSADGLARALAGVRAGWADTLSRAREAWERVPVFADTARSYEALLRDVVGRRAAA